MRYRKIKCPDPVENFSYRIKSMGTGEVIECDDIAELFRRIAWSFTCEADMWEITKFPKG